LGAGVVDEGLIIGTADVVHVTDGEGAVVERETTVARSVVECRVAPAIAGD